MVRDFRHALADMRLAIEGIEHATHGKSLEDFETDWLLRHGVERGIEIISEASRALPEEVRQLRPDIPWDRVRAIGNVLRHQYHGVSTPLVWRVVIDELPKLRQAIEVLQASYP